MRRGSARNTRSGAFWILWIGLGLLGLSGCRTGDSDNNAPANTPKPAEKSATGAPGRFKIAGIGFQDDQFFKLIEFGMKAAAEKEGVELSLGNSGGNLDKEISLIETYTANQINAICVAPLSAKASVPALKRAQEGSIQIVTFDSSVEEDFPASNIKSDQTALGRSTGEVARQYIQDKLGGKAKVAIIGYVSLAPEPARKRMDGFKNEVKKLPGVEIVAEQDAWLAPAAVTVVEGILTAHPDVNVIWAANEGGTVGAVTAVKNAGKAGRIVVFGTDISEQMADFLLSDDNILQAVTGQKPFEIGEMALQTAVKVLKGEKVEKRVELPGALFTRQKSDEVKKHRDYLHQVSQG